MNSDKEETNYNPPEWARLPIEVFAMLALVAVSALMFSNPIEQTSVVPDTGFLVHQSLNLCGGESDGFLSGRLYSALDERIDWSGADMNCEGMLRPDGDGIRLLFASQKSRGGKLVFVFGIDGSLEKLKGKERPTNITIIDESDGRFFSTGGHNRCWATIEKIETVLNEAAAAYQINGEVYCTGGLPSLSDNRSVTLGDFRFSGRLTVEES